MQPVHISPTSSIILWLLGHIQRSVMMGEYRVSAVCNCRKSLHKNQVM
ncbi:hypothetical protein OROHE_005860 [Orobanche hederae]